MENMHKNEYFLDLYFIGKLRWILMKDRENIDNRKIDVLKWALDYINQVDTAHALASKEAKISEFLASMTRSALEKYKILLLTYETDFTDSAEFLASITAEINKVKQLISTAIEKKEINSADLKPVDNFFERIYDIKRAQYHQRSML